MNITDMNIMREEFTNMIQEIVKDPFDKELLIENFTDLLIQRGFKFITQDFDGDIAAHKSEPRRGNDFGGMWEESDLQNTEEQYQLLYWNRDTNKTIPDWKDIIFDINHDAFTITSDYKLIKI